MSGFVKDLESLIGALAHNVITPDQGWAQLEGLKDQRVERRMARKDALAEMLAGIQTAGYESAMEGMPLESVLANPAFSPARQKFGDDALKSLLSPYFGTGGRSTLNPSLSPSDAADIQQILTEEWTATGGAGFDPKAVYQTVMSELPPEVAPEVSKLINDTLNQLKPRY